MLLHGEMGKGTPSMEYRRPAGLSGCEAADGCARLGLMTAPTSSVTIEVRRLVAADWAALREARLTALADAPDAFGSTIDRELGFDEATWRGRLDSTAHVGARRPGPQGGLIGLVAGFPEPGLPRGLASGLDVGQPGRPRPGDRRPAGGRYLRAGPRRRRRADRPVGHRGQRPGPGVLSAVRPPGDRPAAAGAAGPVRPLGAAHGP